MKIRLLAAALMIALTACGLPAPASLGADDILKRAAGAGIQDAHFSVMGTVCICGSNGVHVARQLVGDGELRLVPSHAAHMTLRYETPIPSDRPIETIWADGTAYVRINDWRWREDSSAASRTIIPDLLLGHVKAKVAGETTLSLGKAWHLMITTAQGLPEEAWIRQSDGYLLKFSTVEVGYPMVLNFDRFNRGTAIAAPPLSQRLDDQAAIWRATVNGLSLDILRIDWNYPGSNQASPAPGNRFVVIEAWYRNNASEWVDAKETDWRLSDSAGVIYDPTSAGLGPRMGLSSLAPGTGGYGFISYEVPTSATGLTLSVVLNGQTLAVKP